MVRILRVFLLAFGLAALLLGGFSALAVEKAGPAVRYVAPDGRDADNDCSQSTTACASIQHVVDVAAVGDEVRVAGGRYLGVGVRAGLTQTVYISKSLTLRGGYTTTNWTVADPQANPTILDARGLGRVMTIRGPISVTVDGLEITGGNAWGLGGSDWGLPKDGGGGIYIVTGTLTLTNSKVYSNTAYNGGGLYAAPDGSMRSIVLGNSAFFSNTARVYGGGLMLIAADLQVEGIRVERNLISVAKDLTQRELSDNRFDVIPDPGGGGIYCAGCTGVLAGSYVSENTTPNAGGGLHFFNSRVHLTRNQIVNNRGGKRRRSLVARRGIESCPERYLPESGILWRRSMACPHFRSVGQKCDYRQRGSVLWWGD